MSMGTKIKAGDLIAADDWHIVDVDFPHPDVLESISTDALLADRDRYRAVPFEVWNEYQRALEAFSKATLKVKQCPRVSLAAVPEKVRQ